MINNDQTVNIDRNVTIADFEPPKKKRGRGYTKTLCKKAKAKRRQR